mgnify:FL=1
MKKELIIQFNIIQHENIDKQDDDINLVVYSVINPEKENVITQEELQACGVKKMFKPFLEKTNISDKIGKTFTAKINKEQLAELFNF